MMTKEQRTRQGVFWAVTIGYGLFKGCSSLEEIVIPDNVTEIEQYACSAHRSVLS